MQAFTNLRYKLANFSEVVAFISFIALFIFFTIRADGFLAILPQTNILTLAAVKGIFVIGVAMLMISGEFDLSVGSILAVASYIFAITLENYGMNPWLAFAIGLAASGLLGLINGLIVTLTSIPSFIATLGTMLAYRGIARSIGSADFARYTGESPFLFTLLNGNIDFINRLGTPVGGARMAILWFVFFVVIAALIMRRTQYGSWIYATGGNRMAAIAQGVRTQRVIIGNFVISGLLAGFAGMVQFSSRPAVDPARGEGWELIAVAACVIGGIWLQGGFGTIIGAAIGILLLQLVEQGLILVGVDIQYFQLLIGVILILAVIISTYLSKQ